MMNLSLRHTVILYSSLASFLIVIGLIVIVLGITRSQLALFVLGLPTATWGIGMFKGLYNRRALIKRHF